MRLIGVLATEGACDELASRNVSGPGFAQCAREREQYRARRQRDHRACVAHDIAAGVDDERLRPQQRFDFLEQQQPLLAAPGQTGRGRVEHKGCAFDLRPQRRDIGVARGLLRPGQRNARRLGLQASHRDPRNHQLVGCPRRRRKRRRIKFGERPLGLVEASDQEQPPDREVPRQCRVQVVAVRLQRGPRRVERLRGPSEVARDECDLGLGDDASGAGHRLSRTEGACRTS